MHSFSQFLNLLLDSKHPSGLVNSTGSMFSSPRLFFVFVHELNPNTTQGFRESLRRLWLRKCMERARGLSFVRSLLAMEPLSETGWVKILGTVGWGGCQCATLSLLGEAEKFWGWHERGMNNVPITYLLSIFCYTTFDGWNLHLSFRLGDSSWVWLFQALELRPRPPLSEEMAWFAWYRLREIHWSLTRNRKRTLGRSKILNTWRTDDITRESHPQDGFGNGKTVLVVYELFQLSWTVGGLSH